MVHTHIQPLLLKNRAFLIIVILLMIQVSLPGQTKRLISGSIVDAATNEALPFVTVSLKKRMIGNVTNEEGKFDFYIPGDVVADTLLINYLGYKHFLMDISLINGPLSIKLEQTVVQLEEIVIRPLLPQDYILMAMRKIKENYPKDPFETEAYYREKTIENKNLIRCDEGVFKTHYLSYIDTGKTQNQLMLFRRAENGQKVSFMNRERKKKESKDSITTVNGKENDSNISLNESFGGPADILKSVNFKKKKEDFLDTTQFKSFKYSFAKSSSYNTGEVLVIDFETKGKVHYARESGRIYIDANSLAIINIERKGTLVLPGIVKSIFFVMSIGVKNPRYEKRYEFQQVNGKWYPKNIEYQINITLTNNHLFRKDERSDFEIEQYFIVNQLKTENTSEIPLEKRFNDDKKMEEQVFNDAGLTWEGTNIIKK